MPMDCREELCLAARMEVGFQSQPPRSSASEDQTKCIFYKLSSVTNLDSNPGTSHKCSVGHTSLLPGSVQAYILSHLLGYHHYLLTQELLRVTSGFLDIHLPPHPVIIQLAWAKVKL